MALRIDRDRSRLHQMHLNAPAANSWNPLNKLRLSRDVRDRRGGHQEGDQHSRYDVSRIAAIMDPARAPRERVYADAHKLFHKNYTHFFGAKWSLRAGAALTFAS